MIANRGDVWLADLNPIRGSEQAGIRPVLIFQNDAISKFTSTVIAIPLTTNMRRAQPSPPAPALHKVKVDYSRIPWRWAINCESLTKRACPASSAR